MIGQKKLLQEVNIFSDCPLILAGPVGCGKKTIIKELANKSNINTTIYIDKTVSDDIKLKLYSCTNNIIVVFDLTTTTTIKQFISFQNSILKLLEDIPIYCKFIILVEDSYVLLDTIINRCKKIRYIDNYSKFELFSFADEYNKLNIKEYSENQLKYILYPGDVLSAPNVMELENIEKLVDTILSSIYNANISNVLSISKKLKFTDQEEGYDINAFLNIFHVKILNLIKNDFNERYFKVFNRFEELLISFKNPYSNKRNLVEEFLLSIKYV